MARYFHHVLAGVADTVEVTDVAFMAALFHQRDFAEIFRSVGMQAQAVLPRHVSGGREKPLRTGRHEARGHSIAQTAVQIFLSITAAYAFAKLDFPFKRSLYMVLQSAMFVPFSVLIIPLYQLVVKAGLVDTYAGIILPQVLGVFTTMLLISFFTSIPTDLVDAAKIDGCGYFSILTHVVLANSTTSISAAVLYAFLNHWRSYLWPLLVTNDNRLRTLAVGLKYLISEANSAYQYMIAAALMSILPLMIVYLLCEKNFVRSITMTGMKN